MLNKGTTLIVALVEVVPLQEYVAVGPERILATRETEVLPELQIPALEGVTVTMGVPITVQV